MERYIKEKEDQLNQKIKNFKNRNRTTDKEQSFIE